jgi:hypothetical protein
MNQNTIKSLNEKQKMLYYKKKTEHIDIVFYTIYVYVYTHLNNYMNKQLFSTI